MPRRKKKDDERVDEPQAPPESPNGEQHSEIEDSWDAYDIADSDLSPAEEMLRDALSDIEAVTALCIHRRKTVRATSKAARNRELRELARLMAGIREDVDRQRQLDLITTARLTSRFEALLRLALNQPGEVVVEASLMARKLEAAKAEDMRVARHPESPFIQEVIREIAARWRPDPDRPPPKRRRSINPNAMAVDILDEVRTALAAHRELRLVARNKGKTPEPIERQAVRRWLEKLGFPTPEQQAL